MSAASSGPSTGPFRSLPRRLRDWLIDDRWTIGWLDRPIESLLDHPTVKDATWLKPPKGGYLADPFGLPDGRTVLCEVYDYRSRRGTLAAVTISGAAAGVPCPVAVATGGHVSYPYVFTWAGQCWMVPETAADRAVVLYRALSGGGWAPEITLLDDVAASDATLFPWQGRWWLAHADDQAGSHDTLFLWWAETPVGPWTPHGRNPVKRTGAGARPAGTPFVSRGALYRPGQDCSRSYGGAVILHRIERLTPDDFEERVVVRIGADSASPFPHGLHTLSAWGGRTLLDARRDGVQPAALARRVRHRLGAGG